LLLFSPVFVVLLWTVCTYYQGSFWTLATTARLGDIVRRWPWPTLTAVKILATFAAFEALLMVLLPGKKLLGPITPAGERVEYKLNGPAAFVVTHVAFWLFAFQLKWFSPTIVFDHFGELLMTSSLFALVACVALYFKGIYAPSGKDAGTSGNFIFDFFWGTELYPRLGGLHLKQLANCRVAMMGWGVILISFAAKQHELYHHLSNSMAVCVFLQLVYIAKFFIWEGGYFWSLDIMHDRFGFYIFWGVMAWLPSVYTSQALYLVDHPIELNPAYAALITVFGLTAVYINYAADAQRQRVRATQGNTTVWGKAPDLIVADYQTTDGQQKQSLLLASGWWGLARHFHYVPEIAVAISWSIPCQFSNFLPWVYPTYLTILLVDRAMRDDRRCQAKYGVFWEQYCQKVPYRILPGLF
jgi:7-dehydrocholesterol reductase